MTIALGDAPVLIVDAQFGVLVSTYFTAVIDGLLFRIEMARGAFSASAPYIPSAAGRMWNYMMRLRAVLI